MFTASEFRDLVSGRRRGVAATLLRCVLRAAETPYSLVMRARNYRYDRQSATVTRVAAPVVCVGNLTLGGTGKTPLVEWIARWFRQHDARVAIVSRGYGAEQGARNDEALELEQRLPDVPHLQNADRVAAAQTAIEELTSQVILLDDGFQHRRLGRDLDIVLLDALEPLGYGHVFPRGMLREPLSGLNRAQMIILSRADMVERDQRQRIREVVRQHAPRADWAEVRHAPRALRASDSREEPLDELRGRRIAAFCGIGNPAGFRHTLEQLGATVIELREFPDHHAYDRDDIEALVAWGTGLSVEMIVCTHKDLVKIALERLGPVTVARVVVGIDFLSGQATLEQHLLRCLPARSDD